ncbi:MAG: hypothetical protein ACI8RZ_000271 [Myxococcota bacterium]|jgi:hypothetical protein
MLWMMMAMTAQADSFTLDNGAVIEGRMVVYNYGGECQMSITEGDLVGSIVLIPCDRITSFSRGSQTPAPPMEAPTLTAAVIEQALMDPAEVIPVEAPMVAEEVAAAPPIVEVIAIPVEAAFSEEPVELAEAPAPEPVPEATAPIEEAPEAMAATPWADESGQPADGIVRPEATQPERSIGGVSIPALPNLRIIRSAPEVAPEVDGE